MGISSDGILWYGYCWKDTSEGYPWLKDTDEDDDNEDPSTEDEPSEDAEAFRICL